MDSFTYFKSVLSKEEYECIKKMETLNELVDYSAAEFTTHIMVHGKNASITYGQFAKDVACLRGFLGTIGLPEGAHVGIQLKNSYEWIKLFFAVATAGYVAVLFPPALPIQALSSQIKKMDVDCLFHEETVDNIDASVNDIPHYSMSQCICDQPALPHSQITGATPAVIVYSGGTTGQSKGVLLSHGALMQGAYYGCFSPRGVFGICYLLVLPLTHIFGLVRSLLTPMLTASSVSICENMQDIFQDMQKSHPDIMILVPGIAELLLQFAGKYGVDFLGGQLKVVICGGAPVRPGMVTAMHELGITVCPGYGLTETANLVSGNGDGATHPQSVGIPYMDQQLKLVDGELWVKGPHTMIEYYNSPLETAQALEDGWLKTGDLAQFDEDGFLYITGRLKNLIILESGKKVSPEELEAKLSTLDIVKDVLVYETKNKLGRSILVAELLPMETEHTHQELEDLLQTQVDQINQTLEPYKQIKKIIVRQEDFARSPSMKIIRP